MYTCREECFSPTVFNDSFLTPDWFSCRRNELIASEEGKTQVSLLVRGINVNESVTAGLRSPYPVVGKRESISSLAVLRWLRFLVFVEESVHPELRLRFVSSPGLVTPL